MNQTAKLDQLLGRVGLLRAQFSQIMKTIHERRESFKEKRRYPPEKLGLLMANAQEHFAELLKASDFISTAIGNAPTGDKDRFDDYLDEWIVSQTWERLEGVRNYLEELKRQPAEMLVIDSEVLEKGFLLVDDAFRILD